MRELVEFLAQSLVDRPDEVMVVDASSRRELRYELSVAPGDLGKVIGRQGRTARAIRTVLSAAASLDGRQATLDILD